MDGRLLALISSMEQEGIIDKRLANARKLKEIGGPNYFVELIQNFFTDTNKTLTEMDKAFANTDLDYNQLFQLNMKIKGGVGSVGGCTMHKACQRLRQAIDRRSKEECIAEHETLKNEYQALFRKLDVIVEIESLILSYGPNQ